MKLFNSPDYQFKTELSQLMQVYKSLPLYVSDYFSELRNKVDIACQYFLINQNDASNEKSIQALDNQVLIIEKLKKFESNCLENLDEVNLQEASELIEMIETDENTINASLLLTCLMKIQKQIFLNKTFIFVDTNSTLLKDTQLAFAFFGALVIVEDEFIVDDGFNSNK